MMLLKNIQPVTSLLQSPKSENIMKIWIMQYNATIAAFKTRELAEQTKEHILENTPKSLTTTTATPVIKIWEMKVVDQSDLIQQEN